MPRAPRSRGFTLIEVLVAVMIVAILAGLVAIGLSGLGGDRTLEREAQRLKSHIDYACELAIVNGRSMGLANTDGGYRFLEREAGRWQAVSDQPALVARRLPAGTLLRVRRDGHEQPVAAENGQQALRPTLACLASGELTPFSARLESSAAAGAWIITGQLDGRTRIEHVARQP